MVSEKIKEDWNKLRDFKCEGKSWEGGKWISYPHYEKREEMKDIARSGLWESVREKNYYQAAWFLLHGIITAHYWRAREDLESLKEKEYIQWMKKIRGKKYYKYYRIDIDHYTKHWLWANGDRRELFPQEVLDEIKEHFYYEQEECKYLPKGASLYRDPI